MKVNLTYYYFLIIIKIPQLNRKLMFISETLKSNGKLGLSVTVIVIVVQLKHMSILKTTEKCFK